MSFDTPKQPTGNETPDATQPEAGEQPELQIRDALNNLTRVDKMLLDEVVTRMMRDSDKGANGELFDAFEMQTLGDEFNAIAANTQYDEATRELFANMPKDPQEMLKLLVGTVIPEDVYNASTQGEWVQTDAEKVLADRPDSQYVVERAQRKQQARSEQRELVKVFDPQVLPHNKVSVRHTSIGPQISEGGKRIMLQAKEFLDHQEKKRTGELPPDAELVFSDEAGKDEYGMSVEAQYMEKYLTEGGKVLTEAKMQDMLDLGFAIDLTKYTIGSVSPYNETLQLLVKRHEQIVALPSTGDVPFVLEEAIALSVADQLNVKGMKRKENLISLPASQGGTERALYTIECRGGVSYLDMPTVDGFTKISLKGKTIADIASLIKNLQQEEGDIG